MATEDYGSHSLGHIEKLDGRENYSSWKFAMQACLEAEDLWGCILETPEYVADGKKMTKARAKIVLAIRKQNYGHIQDATTPKEAWDRLKNAFEDKGLTRKVGLLRTLTSTRLVDCVSIEEYVNRITTTAYKLKELDFEVKDEMVGALLLSGLSDEYKPMIMGLENSGTPITTDSMRVKLLQEVKSKTGQGGAETALYANARKKPRDKDKAKLLKCFVCDKVGHFAAKCRNKPKKETENKTESVSNKAFATFKQKDMRSDEWYLDSCASSHMSGNAAHLTNLRKCNKTVTAANYGEMTAKAFGTAEIETLIRGKSQKIIIEDVLYIPELAVNLLSAQKIVAKDHYIKITKRGCIITDSNGDLMATASNQGGIYKLNLVTEQAYATVQETHRGSIWHRRLGHPGRRGMEQLVRKHGDQLSGLKMGKDICDVCVQGKLSKKPFQFSGKRAKNLLDLVHSDICGPMSCDSIGGAKYFITFIDDHSRKKFVYFIKHKSEAIEAFNKFKALVETQTGKRIKMLRTDNAREYIGKEFKNVLHKFGIVHQTTVPYNPQQNGLAERANRSIVERARCLLIDACLPKKYWAEATSTSIYLLNRCPASALQEKTPEELWSRKPLQVRQLKVFGCKAWAHVTREKRDKWDPKAKSLMFVGYEDHVKGYRLIDPQTLKITLSRDVIFREDQRGIELNHEEENGESLDYEIKETNPNQQLQEAELSLTRDTDEEEAVSEENNYEDAVEEEHVDAYVEQQAESNLRRSTRKWKPVTKPGFVSYLVTEDFNKIPNTYEEATNSAECAQWKCAIQEEIKALKKNKTWIEMEQPNGIKPLNTRWVFQKKGSDSEPRFKARLVAKGCAQVYGKNYEDIFSPVVKYETIRFLLATAAAEGWTATHMDVTTAYLNGEIKEDVYLLPPDGVYKGKDQNKIWKLKKALYGLKQSGRVWNEKLDDKLKAYGLRRCETDPCVYVKGAKEDIIIVAIYVDDMLILTKNKDERKALQDYLHKNFEMRNLGEARQFLGFEIHQDNLKEEIKISQVEYIKKKLKEFGMEDCNPVGTPADLHVNLMEEDTCEIKSGKDYEKFKERYLEAVGSLLYIAQLTRPDIAQAVNMVSRFNKEPRNIHWTAVKRLFRYLKGTIDFHLKYSKENKHNLIGFSDADWGNDTKDRKSISGSVFTLHGAAITWYSKKQRTVALSTVEAEYIALSSTCQEAEWLRNLTNEIFKKRTSEALIVNSDSNGAISLSKNYCTSQRTKHIDIRHHFIRDMQSRGNIVIKYLATDEMTADILTKPLPRPKHVIMTKLLGLQSGD